MPERPHLTVYSPEADVRSPLALLRAIIRDFKASWEMAWVIVVRNIKGEYRQTVLGLIWAFLPPIATTLSFVLLESQSIISARGAGTHYGAYVMVGSLLWQSFVDAVNSPLKMVQSSISMLSSVHFPREALILAGVGECLFNFGIRLLLLLAVFFYYDLALPATLPLGLAAVLVILIAGLVIGLALIPLGMLYHDIEMGLGIALSFWFFITPIAYATPDSGILAVLNNWNPLSPLLTTARAWLLGTPTHEISTFVGMTAATLVLFVVALIAYRVAMPHIIKRTQD